MHRAQKYARKVARDNKLNPDTVSARMLDTDFPEHFPCYIITPGCVVYEDEPNCVVSLNHHPLRFIPAKAVQS